MKGELGDYNMSPASILCAIDEINDAPIELVEKICLPLLQDDSFKHEFFFKRPYCVVGKKNSDFFIFWIEQAKAHIKNEAEFKDCYQKMVSSLISKNSPNVSALSDKLIEAVFNDIPPESSIKYRVEQACCHDYSCYVTKGLNEKVPIIFLQSMEQTLSLYVGHAKTLLKKILANLREEQRNKFLLVTFLSKCWSMTKIMLELSVNACELLRWRDEQGRTILHYDVIDRSFFSNLACHYLEGLMKHADVSRLLTARDANDKTALESYFTASLTYKSCLYNELPQSAFVPLLEKTLALSGLPKHCDDLLSELTEKSGFQSWLLIRLVQEGLNPETLAVKKYNEPPSTRFAQNFKRLLCQYKPLKTTDQQVSFLEKASGLGFIESAALAMVTAFPVHVRKAFMGSPFSKENQTIWESEVLPLPVNYRAGCATTKKLPWTPWLTRAFLCYEPTKEKDILDFWAAELNHMADQNQLGEFNFVIPTGQSGVYGRSCFFTDPEGADTLRLKFRKKLTETVEQAEPWCQFASEPVNLNSLRELQRSGKLALKSHFPEPVDMYRIPDFQQWLLQSPLSAEDQIALRDCVFVEEDGSACVYVYKTKQSEQYHLYPYDSKEAGLQAIRVAAFDLGLLKSAGLAAQIAPMYHNLDYSYIILYQLCNSPCPGKLFSWDFEATNYPNISPDVGIRDYADIFPFSDLPMHLEGDLKNTPENQKKVCMEQIAREFFSLTLILARTMSDDLNFEDEKAVDHLESEIINIAEAFFGNAFKMSPGVITKTLMEYGIPRRLALEISFWCDRSTPPSWLTYLKANTMPESVYPKSHQDAFDSSVSEFVSDRGMFETNKSQGINLGLPNGILPLLELNKLLTMVFNIYIHKGVEK